MIERAVRSWRAISVLLIAFVAVSWLCAVLIQDLRRPPDADCLSVDSSVLELIASRPIAGPIEPISAVAVLDPWTRSTGSTPFDNYYAIAMKFRAGDGSTTEGTWGLGTGPAPESGRAISANADAIFGSSLVNVDSAARTATDWPDTDMFFPEDANAVETATRCLADRRSH